MTAKAEFNAAVHATERSLKHTRTSTTSRRQRRPKTTSTQLERRQSRMLRELARIKAATPDGTPLTGADAQFVYAVLTNHPRAAEKIGPGVRAITVDTFVGDTRCFFVIRTDGTAIDFSARSVIFDQWQPRRPTMQTLMDRFPYAGVVRRFWEIARRIAVTR
jgi:K+-sensing histidine kinase KdpD